jgi:hypothetical protein
MRSITTKITETKSGLVITAKCGDTRTKFMIKHYDPADIDEVHRQGATKIIDELGLRGNERAFYMLPLSYSEKLFVSSPELRAWAL